MVTISSSISFSTAAARLTSGGTYTLGAGSYLLSTVSDGIALEGTSQVYEIVIGGLAQGFTSSLYAGIYLSGSNSAAITIEQSGVARGHAGIYLEGAATIVNHGGIFATSHVGVFGNTAAAISITNTGTIQTASGLRAIEFTTGSSGEHSINNSGVISGAAGSEAIGSLNGSSVDLLTNTGTINGNVSLGGGNDIVHSDGGAGVIYGAVYLGNGNDEFYGGMFADTVYGESDTDTILGNDGDDIIYGGHGDEQSLDGGHGNDSITGGGGYDILVGGEGDDTLTGGGSDDDYYVDSQGDVIVEDAGGGGADSLFASVSYILGGDDHVEKMFASVGTASIDLTGNGLTEQWITGNDGANRLDGGGKDGMVDSLSGGGGDDIYFLYDETADEVFDTAGSDTIVSEITRNLAGFEGVDNILLSGNAAAGAIGNDKQNRLTGNTAANTLEGGGGNDALSGMEGADTLAGGGGKDVFIYGAVNESGLKAAGRDVILDFKRGADKIDVSLIDAIDGGKDNAFGVLAKGTAGSDVGAGKIGFYWIDKQGTADDMTILRFNSDRDADIEMTLALAGLKNLTSDDFYL